MFRDSTVMQGLQCEIRLLLLVLALFFFETLGTIKIVANLVLFDQFVALI